MKARGGEVPAAPSHCGFKAHLCDDSVATVCKYAFLQLASATSIDLSLNAAELASVSENQADQFTFGFRLRDFGATRRMYESASEKSRRPMNPAQLRVFRSTGDSSQLLVAVKIGNSLTQHWRSTSTAFNAKEQACDRVDGAQ